MSRRKRDDWLQPSLLDLVPAKRREPKPELEPRTEAQQTLQFFDDPPAISFEERPRRPTRVIETPTPPTPPTPPSPPRPPPTPLPTRKDPNELPWLRMLDETGTGDSNGFSGAHSDDVSRVSDAEEQGSLLPVPRDFGLEEKDGPRDWNAGRISGADSTSRLGIRWRLLVESERWVARLSRADRLELEDSATGLEVRAGAVEAGVRNKDGRPFRVQLRLPKGTPAEWARVARSLPEEPELLAEVRQGRLPTGLVNLSEAEGLSLVPPRLTLLRSACTCGDRRGRCEHVLAVHLAFARLLETEPSALLIARGARADSLVELVDRIHDTSPESTQGAADASDVGTKAFVDPFTRPNTPEPDWSLLDAPRPAQPPPSPPPDAWYGDESFEGMIQRLIDLAAS